jgi:cell division protein FtsQ
MQQGVPRTGRSLPGMPLEMEDPDGDDLPRSKWGRASVSNGRWWWPQSTVGRVFLALGALIVIVAITAAVDLSKTYLERDSRFRIAGANHIQATGLTEVSRAQMLPVFGEDIGRNVFFVPIGERRKQLEAIPWIQQATVMRLLPDQLRVDVVERKPVAFTRHGQQIGLVDPNGVLLDMGAATMAAHHYSFPVVTGIDPGDKPTSRQARMALYSRLMSELDANNQHYSEQISEIDLTDPEDARVLMPEQGADILAHFGEDHFLERYQRYKQHIAEWRQQYPKLAAVDLRYEHQVVLDMASGASAAQPTGDPEGAKTLGDVSAQPKSSASPAASKPAAKSSPGKAAKVKSTSKPSGSSSAKSKSSTSKTKANQNKKHTQSKTAVQNTKKKPSPAARPKAAEGQ